MSRCARLLLTAGLLLATSRVGAQAPVPARNPVPLLTWDVLTSTVYDPRRPLIYPPAVEAADGATVRLEGFLMPQYGAQDPGDLFLTALNPRNFFCGPSDITQMVELHISDLEDEDLPELPVEVTGTFQVSRAVGSLRPIYRFVVSSWRPLRTWEQPFPGVIDEERRSDTDPSFGTGG